MTVTTGTQDTRTRHSKPAAAFNVVASMLVPAALALLGLFIHGWDAIEWLAAICWGATGAALFAMLVIASHTMGITRIDFLDLLGSVFATPGTLASRAVGAAIHLVNGAILGIGFAYAAAFLDLPANWATGIAWGLLLWLAGLVMLTSIGPFHPAIRRGREPDPGPLATHLGSWTPVVSLVAHVAYGLILGLFYDIWPIG